MNRQEAEKVQTKTTEKKRKVQNWILEQIVVKMQYLIEDPRPWMV